MFETFEHTADLGLRIRAGDLEGLFVEGARALFSVIVANPEEVQPRQKVDIRLEAEEPVYLFFDWLKELLFHFDSRHLLFSRFEVRLDSSGLTAAAWGEPLDRNRHVLEHEVKAITYHGLTVQKTQEGWMAEVIVDI